MLPEWPMSGKIIIGLICEMHHKTAYHSQIQCSSLGASAIKSYRDNKVCFQ